MRALHRATVRLYEDLSLEGVLQRVIAAAKELTNARYAALGIPNKHGGLETFISLGLTAEEADGMPHPPRGEGLLGEMLRIGESIRIPEIKEHPKSVGFPSKHPEMHSFLGVPISAYGWPLGQIYLTEKEGAEEFTEEDQRLIEMLAAHAAAAIENARLYQRIYESQAELEQRKEELELVNYMTNLVSSTPELDGLMELTLERVGALFASSAGEIFLRQPGSNIYQLAIHRGETEQAFWDVDRFHVGEGLLGMVAQTGEPFWSADLASVPKTVRRALAEAGYGALVCVPLVARGDVVGILSLVFPDKRTMDERELGLLGAVGAGVGIAIENARLNRQSRRLAVLEERERIGMDLHDGIIQSIYAVGLSLESTRLQMEDTECDCQDRIDKSIDSLNAIIRDLRTYILDLQPTRMLEDNLPLALARLAAEFRANTAIELDYSIEELALKSLNSKASAGIYHIAQEALANVAKHSMATRAWVTIRQIENEILLQVIDNGQGFDMDEKPEVLGHGLSNMAIRASAINGTCEVISSPGEGTTVSVSVRLGKEPSGRGE